MATIGKWWGRTRLNYKADPGWIIPGNKQLGPYIYEKTTGKWFGISNAEPNGALVIRGKYISSNLASVNYSGYPQGLFLFAYGGFLYSIRSNAATPFSDTASLILFKIDPLTGTVTDVKTIFSTTKYEGHSFAFDGTQTVYLVTAYRVSTIITNNISKYDLVSDVVTSLRTETTYAGGIFGVGVDASKVYWMTHSTTTQWYTCMMTTAGAGFAAVSVVKGSGVTGYLGYKGFYFFDDEFTIQIQGGSSFTLSMKPEVVFVDDSQGIANSRFGFFSHASSTTIFIESDGGTLKMSASKAGNLLTQNRGVFAFRPDSSIEEAATIIAHDRATWYEAVSMMKESI